MPTACRIARSIGRAETMSIPVTMSIQQTPIAIKSLSGSGVDASFSLWDGAKASEFFPSTVASAGYRLMLEKQVSFACDVRQTEQDLIEALILIARCWSFSGGCHMSLDASTYINAAGFENNADEVERQLL